MDIDKIIASGDSFTEGAKNVINITSVETWPARLGKKLNVPWVNLAEGGSSNYDVALQPIQHIDDHLGEIALCILSAINVGKVRNDGELEELCDLAVRALEELIDYQEYPVKAAEVATKARRSLGVGFIGLAHYLAKLGYNYDSQEAWDAVHSLSESFQYYLLKASNQLAKEKGWCENFGRTKYSDGILPIDTYKKDVDEISEPKYQHDWESLRASILEHGLRPVSYTHLTLPTILLV